MSEPAAIQVKTVDSLPLDAATAFAKLRTFTPGRGAFLIESLRPSHPHHRYSIVGYRALRAELMPPGVDPLTTQTNDMRALERPEAIAARIAQGCVGFASYGAASLKQGIRIHDDEQCAGYFLLGCTVMVFDHHEGTVTVAGRRKGNLVERCLYEATHAPDIDLECALADGDDVAGVQTTLSNDKLSARAARARAFVGDELDRLRLAQTYHVALPETDPFDAYRAWRKLVRSNETAEVGYYIDFGQSPVSPEMQVYGVTSETVFNDLHGPSADEGPEHVLGKLVPHPRTVGHPASDAAILIRRLEEGSRHLFGGLVGFIAAGGQSLWLLADRSITAQNRTHWYTVSGELEADTDPLNIPALARSEASEGLRALRSTQTLG